jgi:hypothetical protein
MVGYVSVAASSGGYMANSKGAPSRRRLLADAGGFLPEDRKLA